MKLERADVGKTADHAIPGFLIRKDVVVGGALLLHPYGGSKEHMLGLAASLAEAGWAALAVDNCGHGENQSEIGTGMLDEVEAGLSFLRRFGRTAAIGISIGGRLSLMSSADMMVAISPAVVVEMSPQGKWMFENFPSPAVREPYAGYVVKLLDDLGPVREHSRPCLLLYAERDIPAIMNGAAGLQAVLRNAEVRHITQEIRPDIQHENGFIRYLPRWFNHGELKFNSEVIRTTTEWLAQAKPAAPAATMGTIR
jgi:pimeloyl-ACP methyl ester carboxylesterase